MIKKEKRDKIVALALQDKATAELYKIKKRVPWAKNENMYYGKKESTDTSRANVDLGQMQEHVHTLLSKIDSPLVFNFLKTKASQTRRVERLNALREFDSDRDFWDIKDIVGKKQMILYGRSIYSYSADSVYGYKPHLDNVDVYDFLIDPEAGGIDIERARYMGRYGVIKDRQELKSDKSYIKTEVNVLLEGKGNADEYTKQKLDRQNRENITGNKSGISLENSGDKFVFWEWYQTFEGQRYYLLMTDSGSTIRVEKIEDVTGDTQYPFWTYAAYPDMTEFWTPSPADYVREIIMAQSISINQMIDNAERVNKPQKAIDTGAIRNLAELKYRRDGYIKMTPGSNANSAIKLIEVPSITTPIKVFEVLESIKSSASGVTAGAKGVEDTTGRATIYEGNQANVADRFALFNKSYSFGYKRFADLWAKGVDTHLTKAISIEILGPDGIETKRVSRRDIFRKGDRFSVTTEESNADFNVSEQKKRGQGAFFASLLGRPDLANQKVVIEQLGIVNGVKKEILRQLLETDEFGSSEVINEAERDIEELLEGKVVQPNRLANTAYKQHLVNYMLDHEEDMSGEQATNMLRYIDSLEAVVVQNAMREARNKAMRESTQQGGSQTMRQPGPAQPLQDVIQQNAQV